MKVYREQERVKRCYFRKYFYEEDLSPLKKLKKNRNLTHREKK